MPVGREEQIANYVGGYERFVTYEHQEYPGISWTSDYRNIEVHWFGVNQVYGEIARKDLPIKKDIKPPMKEEHLFEPSGRNINRI